jgi:hypothetical protein
MSLPPSLTLDQSSRTLALPIGAVILGEKLQMRARTLTRAAMAVCAFATLPSALLTGQVVAVSGSGDLSGPGCIFVPADCLTGGFVLRYANTPIVEYLSPTLVDLGAFATTFSPQAGSSPLTAFPSGLDFVLAVTLWGQVSPIGMVFVPGSFGGALAYNPSASTLTWTPAMTEFSIGDVTFRLVTDDAGSIVIQPPDPAAALTAVRTHVNAEVTTAPEPSTFFLVAPGLVLLGLVSRRRRPTERCTQQPPPYRVPSRQRAGRHSRGCVR